MDRKLYAVPSRRLVVVRMGAGRAPTATSTSSSGCGWRRLTLSVGGREHRLAAGDCLAMLLDGPIAFHNPGEVPARYAVVLTAADL